MSAENSKILLRAFCARHHLNDAAASDFHSVVMSLIPAPNGILPGSLFVSTRKKNFCAII